MAIINASGPGSLPKIPFGRPVLLGSVTTATDGLQFSISGGASGVSQTMGSILFQFIPNGTLTTGTFDLRASLDGGTTFAPQTGNQGGATLASTTSALNMNGGAGTAGAILNLQIPNLAAQVSFRMQTTALTLGTATKVDVWVLIG